MSYTYKIELIDDNDTFAKGQLYSPRVGIVQLWSKLMTMILIHAIGQVPTKAGLIKKIKYYFE